MGSVADRPADAIERMDLIIALGQTELAAQVAQEAGIDTKAIGMAGVGGALLIGVVAASTVLGPLWWLPGAGFLAATVFAVLTLFADPLKTGPALGQFYAGIRADSAETAKRKAIEDLSTDISDNSDLLHVRRALFQRTVWLFAASLLISLLVLLASRR